MTITESAEPEVITYWKHCLTSLLEDGECFDVRDVETLHPYIEIRDKLDKMINDRFSKENYFYSCDYYFGTKSGCKVYFLEPKKTYVERGLLEIYDSGYIKAGQSLVFSAKVREV